MKNKNSKEQNPITVKASHATAMAADTMLLALEWQSSGSAVRKSSDKKNKSSTNITLKRFRTIQGFSPIPQNETRMRLIAILSLCLCHSSVF
ncbi:hypothetical protein [Alicycliphilus denitrificans]|uniref:hypothetical protein n=1 Tax=Alicycliphilus denitrificans TaxID=179636 RepID=UPI003A808E49